MSSGTIRVERRGATCILTIDRPEKRNALSYEMWTSIPRIMAELAEDDDVAVVVIAGAAGNFCAGSDISDLGRLHTSEVPVLAEEAVASFPKPVIAAITGNCMGGGCQLAAACDIRIAAEDARFSIPPAKLGIVFPASGMRRLLWLVGPSALKHLIFTAQPITAGRALHIGLIDEMVPPDTTLDRALHLAATMSTRSQVTLQATKEQVIALTTGGEDVGEVTRRWYDEAENGPDMPEGMESFAQRRDPDFTWRRSLSR